MMYYINDFKKEFPTDNDCLEFIKQHRYPHGVYCSRCGEITRHYKVSTRTCYACAKCGHHVYPTANTIFHKSSTSLRTWFYIIYLMASNKCNVTTKEIQNRTGVTYKTAWRIRNIINKFFERKLLQYTS